MDHALAMAVLPVSASPPRIVRMAAAKVSSTLARGLLTTSAAVPKPHVVQATKVTVASPHPARPVSQRQTNALDRPASSAACQVEAGGQHRRSRAPVQVASRSQSTVQRLSWHSSRVKSRRSGVSGSVMIQAQAIIAQAKPQI